MVYPPPKKIYRESNTVSWRNTSKTNWLLQKPSIPRSRVCVSEKPCFLPKAVLLLGRLGMTARRLHMYLSSKTSYSPWYVMIEAIQQLGYFHTQWETPPFFWLPHESRVPSVQKGEHILHCQTWDSLTMRQKEPKQSKTYIPYGFPKTSGYEQWKKRKNTHSVNLSITWLGNSECSSNGLFID